jgi:excisionase family DNA binding protein
MKANGNQAYGVSRQKRVLSVEELGAKVLNISEVAFYLHVHRSTAYRMVQSGELPGFKIGSDWRFNLEEIDKWRLGKSQAAVSEKTAFKNSQGLAARLKEQNGGRRSSPVT